ncbi:hypothetical protein Ddc_19137 [Ditylenchus destructor]|nr:hypothetical protein Ddc_19137 [Ditylenchus destructor]
MAPPKASTATSSPITDRYGCRTATAPTASSAMTPPVMTRLRLRVTTPGRSAKLAQMAQAIANCDAIGA